MHISGLPASFVIKAINHVLGREPWAMARLAAFSGEIARLSAPPVVFSFAVASDGSLNTLPSTCDVSPLVSIALPQDSISKALFGQFDSVLSAATISGSADFAEALSFVFKNLHWDLEADLASLVGDIPAWRSMQALRHGLAWQKASATNALANVKEYLVEESGQVLDHQEILDFSRSVAGLRDDLARLEKRIAKL